MTLPETATGARRKKSDGCRYEQGSDMELSIDSRLCVFSIYIARYKRYKKSFDFVKVRFVTIRSQYSYQI